MAKTSWRRAAVYPVRTTRPLCGSIPKGWPRKYFKLDNNRYISEPGSSRSDFIVQKGVLYLIHGLKDRSHIPDAHQSARSE